MPFSNNFGSVAFDSNNSISGGYCGSTIYNEKIGLPATVGNTGGTINEQLYAEFGSHLKTYNERLSTSVDTTSGFVNYGWNLVQASLLTENEICGTNIVSDGGYDIGTCFVKYPLFNFNNKEILGITQFLLRSIPKKSLNSDMNKISCYRSEGYIAFVNLTDNTLALRPKFMLA